MHLQVKRLNFSRIWSFKHENTFRNGRKSIMAVKFQEHPDFSIPLLSEIELSNAFVLDSITITSKLFKNL